MSLRDNKERTRGRSERENRIIMIAIAAAVVVFVLWWIYGYHFVVVPSGELSFRAP